MQYRWVVAAVLASLVLLAGAAFAREAWLQREMYERFGPSPSLGISLLEGREDCHEIVAVHPVAHYNWLGRIWQDPTLDWADVQIQHPPPREFAHNHSGPVRVGDVVCGFGEVSDIRYVHRPTGVVLTETCESYRCPWEE